VAERARKAKALARSLEEEKREHLALMASRAQAQEAMKMWELLSEAKTDAVVGASSSSSVMS
jgi:hypothetical protein